MHRFYEHQLQMNDGKMDKFVAWTDSGGQPMGYYDTTKLPLFPYARDYAFADNFFTAAFGGSWLNHMWLVCACTPPWPNAPAEYVSQPEFDASGKLVGIKDNESWVVTPDGYAVNTGVDSFYPPHGALPDDHRLPPIDLPTIGDRLSAAGISGTSTTAVGRTPSMALRPSRCPSCPCRRSPPTATSSPMDRGCRTAAISRMRRSSCPT